MNFFKLHIGDYITHTGANSVLEDGIYLRLLMRYYMTEKPLPADQKQLARLIRARSRWEVQALARCVSFYFSENSDGTLHNSRADKEIEQYQAQASANRSNSRKRFDHDSIPVRSPNQNHKPEPETKKEIYQPAVIEPPAPNPGNGKVTTAGAWAIELKRRGVAVTSMHPTLLAWIEDGFTIPQVVEALAIARDHIPEPRPVPPNYLDPILRKPPKKSEPQWWLDDAKIEAKAREYGISSYGKQRDELKSAIFAAIKAGKTKPGPIESTMKEAAA